MDETRFKIYSLMVVKNEADVIAASLRDACRWSDKIIVIDNGSTDGTWESVQELAQEYPQIIPWLRDEGPFHIGLRAKAFRAFRHEMRSDDWWNVRLDADEFYPGDVRAFLAQVPRKYRTVKKTSTDYILTKEDIAAHTFSGDFEKDRAYITHSLPMMREERRFMRHSACLCWSEKWRYPHPWGRVYTQRIPVDHYQYRSPEQMAKRYATRQQAKNDGCGSFHHEQGSRWEDYLMSNKELAEKYILAHLEQEFQSSRKVLYQKRNTLKLIGDDIVVKAFHKPMFPNSLIYGLLRASKAKRSYDYARELGELTPAPLGYIEKRRFGLLRESYYACRLSALPYTFRQVERDKQFPHRAQIIQGVGLLMAQLHERGFYPLDFSGGNILLNADGSKMELIDLNRMRRCRHIGINEGMKMAYRLVLTEEERRLLEDAYTNARKYE